MFSATTRFYSFSIHYKPALNIAYNAALQRHGVFKFPGKLYPSPAITEADLEQTQDAILEAVRSTFLNKFFSD